MLSVICAGWINIEPWKCASRGCCYDVHTPRTVGDDNAKVSQPDCYAQNAGPSNYDLAKGLTNAGWVCFLSVIPVSLLAHMMSLLYKLGRSNAGI